MPTNEPAKIAKFTVTTTYEDGSVDVMSHDDPVAFVVAVVDQGNMTYSCIGGDLHSMFGSMSILRGRAWKAAQDHGVSNLTLVEMEQTGMVAVLKKEAKS